MGPKKGGVNLENLWRTRIEDGVLDESKWKVKVIMMEAAGSEQDCMYLNKFETFAAEEKRFVIKNICKTETIFMINQLGVEKKVKDDNLRIFEEGQSYLKDKKDIPTDVLALTIKHLILKMKDEYLFIKRQRLEVKEGLHRESATMIAKEEVRGTIAVAKPPEEEQPKPKKGKGKGTGDADENIEPTSGKKYNTVLRERGEEWRDKVYVNDFPTDGPNLYVAVTGFLDPFLPRALIQIGVPVTAVVQIRINTPTENIPPSLSRGTKRGQSLTNLAAEKSLQFWSELQNLRIHKDSAEDLRNTAFILFSPPYWDHDTLTGQPDVIYDELCYLIYDVQDLTRQHFNFTNTMDIVHISQDVVSEIHKISYDRQIDDLPLECVTIYSVLDGILHVATKSDIDISQSGLTLNQTTSNKAENINDSKAENFIRQMFDSLCKTECNKNYRITYGEEYENHRDPVIIKYGDYAKVPTFHLGNIGLDNIVVSTLYGMPFNRLWDDISRPEGEHEAKINFHVNILLSCFDRADIETAELERLIHILSCRKLLNNRSSLKKQHLEPTTITEFKKVYLKRSILAEPLPKCGSISKVTNILQSCPSFTKSESGMSIDENEDDESETSRIKFLFDCPDLSELVSAVEIASNEPVSHVIENYEYFEDFPDLMTALQVLHNAFTKFNCVDYKYCEVTDCILLMFFNSHDKDYISRDEWRYHLLTPVCLQDFFDFTLDEHYDWIKDQERLHEEYLEYLRKSELQDDFSVFGLSPCVHDKDVAGDLLMEGSLKFQDLHQDDDTGDGVTEKSTTTQTKITNSPVSSAVDKSSKPNRSPNNVMKIKVDAQDSAVNVHAKRLQKSFTGYDLGDRRVEAFGKDSTYFSKDGTRVTSNYSLVIPSNLEYVVLNVVPGGGYNEFWIHRGLGDFIPPLIRENCHSFRVNSKDRVIMNIKRQIYKVPVEVEVEQTQSLHKTKVAPVSEEKICIEPEMETKFFHSFCVTWPNGQVTESVHDENAPEISHIKQYFSSPMTHLNEECRCITINGEVIIFRPNGDIQVLLPDASELLVTKCGKRVVQTEEEMLGESDKLKKGKTKEKDKAKDGPKKGAAKTSKQLLEKVFEKPPEYELFIDEFFSRDTDGLKQKWIMDEPFEIEKCLTKSATDFCVGEIFRVYQDGKCSLLNKDGAHVVTFLDNTKITTEVVICPDEVFPEWTDEEREYFQMNNIVGHSTTKSKGSKISEVSCEVAESSISTESKKSVLNIEEEEIRIKESLKESGYVFVELVFTVEHPNFCTVKIDKKGNISVESPNSATISVDPENNYVMTLDETTSATFDGNKIHIDYLACEKCDSHTTCDINFASSNESSSHSLAGHNNVDQTEPTKWLVMKDSFSKTIYVDYDGNINILEEKSSEEVLVKADEVVLNKVYEEDDGSVKKQETDGGSMEQMKSEEKIDQTMPPHEQCREEYHAKSVRFFVMDRNLKVSELVHKSLVEEYKLKCLWQPWCNIAEHDTFGDSRMLHTILTPIIVTETEKWQMPARIRSRPKNLTYKDLVPDTTGTKGWYQWMRPYKRFVPNMSATEVAVAPKLPKAFCYRVLERQWTPEDEKLKGARELLEAILKYRRIMESDYETLLRIPLIDCRSTDERRIYCAVQAIGNKIYNKLMEKIDEDLQNRAKADITTKPPVILPEENVSCEEETEDERICKQYMLDEERRSDLRELEDAEKLSPELARYWRRRAEVRKEEEFYWLLLREGVVPPYFRNMLGGAIWWEVSHTAEESITKAQRRKMKCVCEDGTTSKTPDVFEGGVFDVIPDV